MSARYAPLPNPHTDPEAIDEMEAAFDDSDDDEDDRAPLTSRNGNHSLPNAEPLPHGRDHEPFGRSAAQAAAPAAYDFENTDYDYVRPPPGSPPGPSSRALPNEFGNSNGLVPSFSNVRTDASSGSGRRNWISRTAASVLPNYYVERWGLGSSGRSQGPVGGGTANDGVFANVTAKPSRLVRVQEGA